MNVFSPARGIWSTPHAGRIDPHAARRVTGLREVGLDE